MKRVIQSVLFAFIASSCFSQIPNSGFETWTNMGAYENPASWGTMNNATAPSGIFTATKAAPGSPGSFYMKLTSKTIGGNVANGIAVSGILDTIEKKPKSGFPFALRPQTFTGKWQHMIYGSSAGAVTVFLTKWNTSLVQRDTVAFANYSLSDMAMSWANFSINFNYLSVEFPDTCVIFLRASGSSPTANDYLWVDNLSFSGSVSGISETEGSGFSLNAFPNPANDQIEFTCSASFHSGDRMIISDMYGKVVFDKPVSESSVKINTSHFANGTYVCKLVNNYNVQYYTDKFTIQH
ncbi:MAG: T9SS type A sorting domain-containing protein [Bacteroidales bacterium]|jgi:hypothetical protein|nr:T9SS type A sorting domain-containing protein [Bacteroidales bacterium]